MAKHFGKKNTNADLQNPAEKGVRPDGMTFESIEQQPSEEVSAMLLTRDYTTQKLVGEKDIARAAQLLQEYKRGKTALESRVVDDELWWELRHWEAIRGQKHKDTPEPTSAWLFNSILNKHADAMDNMPEPVVLPREASDMETAKMLTSVLPVVMANCEFEQTYSDNWWEKLKHGTSAYGIFWNSDKENGLGDIDIRPVDLLKLFWEPGVTDIQRSRNLFIVELVDNDVLEDAYPQSKGRLKGNTIDVKQYLYDEAIDTSNKSVVVDWYYKAQGADGRMRVHYCKFVGNTILYASQNAAEYQERGYYDHGMYPVVLDVMFPEKGTPCGFGYVAITKSPQMYIDKLSANIMQHSMMGTKPRFLMADSSGVNKKQFLNWEEPFVDVGGGLDESRIREIKVSPIEPIYMQVLQQKVEEMKDTAANRDVNSGGTGSGVTAAAAIAALQEAGNKASRDMISASYRTYTKMVSMCIELIRQFYTEERTFRITAANEQGFAFVAIKNENMVDQPIGRDSAGAVMYRRPVFDLDVKAQKKNPFSQMEQNERAKELYSLGFFAPDKAQESLIALDMMDFEGIDEVKRKIGEGNTLYKLCESLAVQVQQLRTAMGIPAVTSTPATTNAPTAAPTAGGGTIDAAAAQAQTPMTSYGDALAKRSVPNMEAGA